MSKIHRWVSGMLTIGLAVSALSGCAALEALKEIRGDPDNGTTQTHKDKLPAGSRDPSGSRAPSSDGAPTGLEDQADGEEIIPLEELSLEMLQEEIIQNGGSAGIAISVTWTARAPRPSCGSMLHTPTLEGSVSSCRTQILS